MTGRADLHVHTTASDGQFSPEQVVEMARNCHLRAIAITDHETTLGNRPAQRAAEGSRLTVVAGVEISTESSLGELHILGYLIDPEADGLEARLAELREGRLQRARRMLARLAEVGLPLDWEHVRQLAGGESVGRPHVARAMVERGYVANTDEAFALYIGHGGPAYVPRLRVLPAEAIAMIRRAHGVPVLAHPLQVYPVVPELVRAGLQGMETSYPGYSIEEVSFLEQIARRHGLVCTGGSDFHGPAVSAVELGSATVPFSTVAALEGVRTVPVCRA
ncbi:MAG: PHP domain-containing protein [Anaerolineae bacterium]